MPYVLAGDLGGTRMRTALVDNDGHIRKRSSQLTGAKRGPDIVIEKFLHDAIEIGNSVDKSEIVGISLALSGPIDPVTGTLRNPPHLPGWDGFSPKFSIQKQISLPITLVNDATAATLAEHLYGAGRGLDNMIYMTISTGIGGGIIVNGKLVFGAHGFAGEVGHQTIDTRGPRCHCGKLGCLESFSSGTALARIARQRASEHTNTLMLDLAEGNLDYITSSIVANAARVGDILATEVMNDAMTRLAVGIVNLIHVLNPELIVIGGGMSNNFDLIHPILTREIKNLVMAPELAKVPVVKSELGDEVGVIGAAAMVFKDIVGSTES